jgi:hypothetical protein
MERLAVFGKQNAVNIFIPLVFRLDTNCFQIATTGKRPISDSHNVYGDADRDEAAATGKRILSDSRNTGRDPDRREAATAGKRSVSDSRNAGVDADRNKAATSEKRPVSDSRNARRDNDSPALALILEQRVIPNVKVRIIELRLPKRALSIRRTRNRQKQSSHNNSPFPQIRRLLLKAAGYIIPPGNF